MLIGLEERAEGRLLFEPDAVQSVTDAAGTVTYAAGADYLIDRHARRIVRRSGSTMPWVTAAGAAAADGALTHGRTVAVTYRHPADHTWFPAEGCAEALSRVRRRLHERQPVTVVVTGDSIAAGYDASEFHDIPPFQPPFATLVAAALEQQSGAAVRLHNRAVPGWTAADALWETAAIAALRPDLVIVAFGMNDACYADGDEYAANVFGVVRRVREAYPGAEFLLVSPMLPTPECSWVNHDRFEEYRSRLAAHTEDGVALADVTRAWRAVVARKDPHDLSGNGLNHPNDFGHRIYAQVIVSRVCPAGGTPADAPG